MQTIKQVRRLIQFGILGALLVMPLKSGSMTNGRTTCPTSGNIPVVLSATPIPATWVVVQAPFTNGGTVYVGTSGVTSTTGIALAAGGSFFMPPRSNTASYTVNNIYFACSTNTDAIVYTYAQ
jgi:hypothetical protein